jgi:hypothetical protein
MYRVWCWVAGYQQPVSKKIIEFGLNIFFQNISLIYINFFKGCIDRSSQNSQENFEVTIKDLVDQFPDVITFVIYDNTFPVTKFWYYIKYL